jgi:hypothetical protein
MGVHVTLLSRPFNPAVLGTIMDWIERTVADSLSNLHPQVAMADPWTRQTARLAILQGLSRSRRLGRKKLQEARCIFQKELDEGDGDGDEGEDDEETEE